MSTERGIGFEVGFSYALPLVTRCCSIFCAQAAWCQGRPAFAMPRNEKMRAMMILEEKMEVSCTTQAYE